MKPVCPDKEDGDDISDEKVAKAAAVVSPGGSQQMQSPSRKAKKKAKQAAQEQAQNAVAEAVKVDTI